MAAAAMEADPREEGRTVVVSGVPAVLAVSRMIDKVTIHFQSRRRSQGGDVEEVTYPTNMDGVAFVTFDEAGDAQRVVRKDQQIMKDSEFPEDYLLTVFPFTRDVFFYVASATVDLSVFGRDQESLIQSLRSAHRLLHFRPLPQQRKATIEGPFTAVRVLRQDLIRRASLLESRLSAQTAAVKLKETPLNPRVISPHGSVSSVSRSRSKAQLELASLNSLSTPLQTTGEAAEVQTLLSDTKTQNVSTRQKVSRGNQAVGSFCTSDCDEEEQRVRRRLQMPTEYRTEEVYPRQVLGEEINAGIRSSLSGLDPLPVEEISATQAREDDIFQKRTEPDRVSAAKIRGQNHLGSRHSSTDYMKESDQSSSAVTARLLQTRLKDVSPSSEGDAKDSEELCATFPKHTEETCIWVDSNTFRYIEKFDKKELDRCLSGLDVSIERSKGTDLMCILLTVKQASKTTLRIQQALKNLSDLVDHWQSRLRVHQVNYDEKETERRKLIQICDSVNFLYDDVLYMFEDSCIKVIGPSLFSYLFYERVQDKIAEHKDKFLFFY